MELLGFSDWKDRQVKEDGRLDCDAWVFVFDGGWVLPFPSLGYVRGIQVWRAECLGDEVKLGV